MYQKKYPPQFSVTVVGKDRPPQYMAYCDNLDAWSYSSKTPKCDRSRFEKRFLENCCDYCKAVLRSEMLNPNQCEKINYVLPGSVYDRMVI